MPRFRLSSTVFNFPALARHRLSFRASQVINAPATLNVQAIHDQEAQSSPSRNHVHAPDDFRLPKMTSLVIVLLASALLQVSFFIVVSSSNQYAAHLGGTATFSGLVIGIPTVFSGLALVPITKFDNGGYKRPLHFACASALLGNILYSLAYRANYLYLILIGRIVSGFGFTFWMYSKRYCSDPRIVGVRRRTMLAGWLVLGQGGGLTVGPFIGGLLYVIVDESLTVVNIHSFRYKIGFSNAVFNGYTSPTWALAVIWAVFWIVAAVLFEDVPQSAVSPAIELQPLPTLEEPSTPLAEITDKRQQEVAVDEPALTGRADTSLGFNVSQSVSRHSHIPPDLPDRTDTMVTETGDLAYVETISVETEAQRTRMSAAQWGVTATMCWFAMTCFFILGAWEANIPIFTGSDLPLDVFHFSPSAAGNMIALGGICTLPFLVGNVFVARRVQDRHTLALGTAVGLCGLLTAIAIFRTRTVTYGSFFACWFLVALGFNLSSTVTLSLLSKQLPGEWNARISMAIQYSNYIGRVTGAVWGGAGVKVGMFNYVGMQVGLVGIGAVMFLTLWKELKAKTG